MDASGVVLLKNTMSDQLTPSGELGVKLCIVCLILGLLLYVSWEPAHWVLCALLLAFIGAGYFWGMLLLCKNIEIRERMKRQ